MVFSSSSAPIKTYNVYLSFHRPDLPREFISHLHNHFSRKGMSTFKDPGIERGETIGPEFVKAIRESSVLIVVVSPNYPSSRWCLDELVEIFKCKAASEHMIVIPIFYQVYPSLVRTVRGDYGRVFDKTCEGETEKVKQRWRNALLHIGSMFGELSQDWDDEGAMVEKIATRVSLRLKKDKL